MYISIYFYMYICTNRNIYIYICVCTYVYTCACIYTYMLYTLQPLNLTVLKITSVPHSIDDLVRQENGNMVRNSFRFARNLEHGHMLATPNHKLGASHYAIPRGFEFTTLLGNSKHVLFGSKNAIWSDGFVIMWKLFSLQGHFEPNLKIWFIPRYIEK